MAGFRAIKNQMRRDVHSNLHLPAYYRASSTADWVEVDVRLHTQFNMGGDLDEVQGVQVHDISPRLIFMRDQVPSPSRGAVVSIAAGEAWLLGEALEPDGITITVMAAPVSESETVDYPVRVENAC